MEIKRTILVGMLGVGHVLARHRRLSRLSRSVAWQVMAGCSNAANYDMGRNGERWLIKRYVRSLTGRSVIDVGANAGNWSARQLAIAPTTKVYCIEMVPEFAGRLRERFGVAATVIEAGLSDRIERVIGYRCGGGGRLAPITVPENAVAFELFTRTGDDLVAELDLEDIAAIKIDVDGYDIKVLWGLSAVISEQRPLVQFEYSRFYVSTRCFLKDAYDFFVRLNYRVGRLMRTG